MTYANGVLLKAIVKNIYVDKDDPKCPSRYFYLRVYDTSPRMRAAAVKYDHGLGYNTTMADVAQADGIFQPRGFREFIHKDGSREDRTGSCIGVMRLVVSHLNAGTVSHESVHVACHAWRMHQFAKGLLDTVDLGDNCGPIEEQFAYLISDITYEVNRATFELAMDYRESQRLTTV